MIKGIFRIKKRIIVLILISCLASLPGHISASVLGPGKSILGGNSGSSGSECGVLIFVAASDSSAKSKANADFVCDGIDDDVQINEAIQSLSGGTSTTGGGGGGVTLTEGRFSLSAPIIIDRGIRLTGQTGQLTELYLADGANCNMLEFVVNHADGSRALNIVERMKFRGNRANQAPILSIITGATGTDATPSVIMSAGAFSDYSSNGLAGRKVEIKGTNATRALYNIVSNDADTLTLDKNASSGGAMSGLTLDVEQIYGIYQRVGNTAIDIRMLDIWFDDIAGGGISLGQYWNHQINKDTFEHLDGPAVTIRLQDGLAPEQTHFYGCMSLSIPQVVKVLGAGAPSKAWRIFGNQFSTSGENGGFNVFDIGGTDWIINGNTLNVAFEDDDTYSVFAYDSDRLDQFGLFRQTISNNIILRATINSNYAKHIFSFVGTDGIGDVLIQGNQADRVDKSGTIFNAVTGQCDKWGITGNQFRSLAGDVITIANANEYVINSNSLNAPSGKNEIVFNTSMRNFVVSGNMVTRGFGGSIRTSLQPRITDNIGTKQVITAATGDVIAYDASELDATSNAIAVDLGQGHYVGQIKTIVMTNAANNAVVTVEKHDEGDGKTGTFDAVDEVWVLMWTGTEWTTIKATATIA